MMWNPVDIKIQKPQAHTLIETRFVLENLDKKDKNSKN